MEAQIYAFMAHSKTASAPLILNTKLLSNMFGPSSAYYVKNAFLSYKMLSLQDSKWKFMPRPILIILIPCTHAYFKQQDADFN